MPLTTDETPEPTRTAADGDSERPSFSEYQRAWQAGREATKFLPFDPWFYLQRVAATGGKIPALWRGRLCFRCTYETPESIFLESWMQHSRDAVDTIVAALEADPALNGAMQRLAEIERATPSGLDRREVADKI